MFSFFEKNTEIPTADSALPGRAQAIEIDSVHLVTGNPLHGPWPEPLQVACFGMGCFWGIERLFWGLDGVYSTAVGYSAGHTPNPSYEEVCTGMTGHNEVVQVVFDPTVISYGELLKHFWENHDPTQGMRQGNDTGTQYRSGIYIHSEEQMALAKQSLADYQLTLQGAGFAAITTEILAAPDFYYAEEYHQQYLIKNPGGYCNMQGTGLHCSIPSTTAGDSVNVGEGS